MRLLAQITTTHFDNGVSPMFTTYGRFIFDRDLTPMHRCFNFEEARAVMDGFISGKKGCWKYRNSGQAAKHGKRISDARERAIKKIREVA